MRFKSFYLTIMLFQVVFANKSFISNQPISISKAALSASTKVDTQKVYSSPNSHGLFTVYYYTTGLDAVHDSDVQALTTTGFVNGSNGIPDYVEFVASAADSSYSYIHHKLNYPSAGGTYNIFMSNLGSYYSYAIPGTDSILVDNDLGFLNSDVDIRNEYGVTMAHEYYHMVQFSITLNFCFLSEPSAVWIEDEVYDSANDYLQYLGTAPTIFTNPNAPLFEDAAYSNYDKVVWCQYLSSRFSPTVIQNAWDEYRSGNAAPDIVFNNALDKYDSTFSFSQAFYEFGSWMLYTNERADLKKSFDDAALFPSVKIDTVNDTTYTINPYSFIYIKNDTARQKTGINIKSIGSTQKELGVYVSRISQDTLLSDTLFPVNLSSECDIPTDSAFAYLCLFNANNSTVSFAITATNDISVENAVLPGNSFAVQAFPNPFTPSIRIYFPDAIPNAINIYDIKGCLVASFLNIRSNQIQWIPKRIAAGIFVLNASFGDRTKTMKIILTK